MPPIAIQIYSQRNGDMLFFKSDCHQNLFSTSLHYPRQLLQGEKTPVEGEKKKNQLKEIL